VEEAVLHWSGKSVKHTQFSTFNYQILIYFCELLMIIGLAAAQSVRPVPGKITSQEDQKHIFNFFWVYRVFDID